MLKSLSLLAIWIWPLVANAQPVDASEDDVEIPAAAPPPVGEAPSEPAPSAQKNVPQATAPSSSQAPPAAPALRSGDYVLSGYLQTQFEAHQDSENELDASGRPLNQDRFQLRRTRVRIERSWDYGAMIFELDANTTNGVQFGVRTAEASLHYRGQQPANAPPLVQATMGVFSIPFGAEVLEQARLRFFMERTIASRALFPGEQDLGARLSGGAGFLRYAVALVNGEPAGTLNGFALRDPNSSKDIVARVGVETDEDSPWRFSGGVSMVRGKGFHAGTAAGKDVLTWRDLNEDGVVQQSEITALPGSTALPSRSFDRWALGADAQLRFRTLLGEMRIFGELVVANNLDRGLFVADPVLTSQDARELGYSVGFVQRIGDVGVVGLRIEHYDPNADLFDQRAGKLVPNTAEMRAYSPMVGLLLPGRARLLYQVDFIRDYLARDKLGVPMDRRNDQSTLRLQVEL